MHIAQSYNTFREITGCVVGVFKFTYKGGMFIRDEDPTFFPMDPDPAQMGKNPNPT